MDIQFIKAQSEKDYKAIFDHNIDAFSDTPDFKWTYEEIKREVKEGWSVYAMKVGEEIIAAGFIKLEDGIMLTKNTAIKIDHQGSGHSHKMKEFFEQTAKELKAKTIKHFCRIDNFRMYSLNESHRYQKTNKKLDGGLVVEWVKSL